MWLHLLWIVPVVYFTGVATVALCMIAHKEDEDMEDYNE